jgi:E3 Ubiquitin ligase
MLAELTARVQEMSQNQFIFLAIVLGIFAVVGFIIWKQSFQHARVMEDMPTSKARSAAQGFVELTGTQHALDGAPLTAPLTQTPCTWWSYKIEHKKKDRSSSGSGNSSWVTVEQDTSVGFFNLRDETGEVLVNPRGAAVTPATKKVWYGPDRRPPGMTPGFKGSGSGISIGFGGVNVGGGGGGLGFGRRYRYTERIMLDGESIYALGHFETWSNVAGKDERSERRAELLSEWKKNPAELVERFDEDGDGRIDADEWEQARKAAEQLVEEHVAKAAAKPEVSVLMKPEEDHPFILSSKSQSELTTAYRWKAIAGLVLFLAAGAALGVAVTARLGG